MEVVDQATTSTAAPASTLSKQNTKVVAALRAAAEWLEQHPELPDLYVSTLGSFTTYGRDIRKDLVTVARAMGHAEKDYSGEYLFLRKNFQGVADVVYAAQREQVCERVVVGTKIVPPEPEKVIPAQPEREVEVVEWRCKPLMNQAELEKGQGELPEPEPGAELVTVVPALTDDDIPL